MGMLLDQQVAMELAFAGPLKVQQRLGTLEVEAVASANPEEFAELEEEAIEIGFSGVLSGPLVRSSYRAGRLYRQAIQARG